MYHWPPLINISIYSHKQHSYFRTDTPISNNEMIMCVDGDNNYDYVVTTTIQCILTCFSMLLLHICMHMYMQLAKSMYACIYIWSASIQNLKCKTAILQLHQTWKVSCTEPYHLQVEGFGYMGLIHLTLAINLLVCTYC